VPVRLPDEAPTSQWLRSIRFSGFTATALALVVLFVVVLAPSLKVLLEQRQQIAALEQQVEDAENSLEELTEERARWDDPTYIEAQARERLNYVFPGDHSYVVLDDSSTEPTQNGQPVSGSIQSTQVDWLTSMLASVYTAGLTDAPANELVAPVIGSGQGKAP
jgi:cell division protein FtsB